MMLKRIRGEPATMESGLELVTAYAALDAVFRSRLLDDPRSAIKDRFGVDLPSSLRIRFIERTPDADLLIVLPDLVPGIDESDVAGFDRVFGGAQLHWDWSTGAQFPPGRERDP